MRFRSPLPGTGSLSGPTAWNWARLGEAGLEAGEHRLTLFASSVRPDCLWISRRDAPPDDRKLAAERLRKMRSHLENPIEPIAPDWVGGWHWRLASGQPQSTCIRQSSRWPTA